MQAAVGCAAGGWWLAGYMLVAFHSVLFVIAMQGENWCRTRNSWRLFFLPRKQVFGGACGGHMVPVFSDSFILSDLNYMFVE